VSKLRMVGLGLVLAVAGMPAAVFSSVVDPAPAAAAGPNTASFSAQSSCYSYSVPSSWSEIGYTVDGGSGASGGSATSGSGGLGGQATVTHSSVIKPGDSLHICVGLSGSTSNSVGAGGSGGEGGGAYFDGGAGGAASYIFDTTRNTMVASAGGGGGGGGSAFTDGADGGNADDNGNGGGVTQGEGGSVGYEGCVTSSNPDSAIAGGAGANGTSGLLGGGGGGGGGGYCGGGGGSFLGASGGGGGAGGDNGGNDSGISFGTAPSGNGQVTLNGYYLSSTTVSGKAAADYGSNQYVATVTPGLLLRLAPIATGTVSFFDGTSAISGCQNLTVTFLTSATATCTTTLGLGGHSITGVYSGDSNYLGSTSAPFEQTIGYPTATVLGASGKGSASTSESMLATVTSSDASESNPLAGSVDFDVNGTAISGCQNVEVAYLPLTVEALASCVATLPAGADTLTATYGGTTDGFYGSTSQSVSQDVTGVAMTSSQNPASPVSPVTYMATVTETDGGGTVSFTDNGTAISGCQTLSLNSSDAVSCTTTAGAYAVESIVASYSGDSATPAATSPTLTEQIYGVSAASAPPALANSPFSVSFDPITVEGVTTSNLTVEEAGSSTPLAGTMSCTDTLGNPVSCASGPVLEAYFTPTKSLIAGQYYDIGVNLAAGGIETTGGYPEPTTQVPVRAQTQFGPFDPALTYKWAQVRNAKALGGSYVEEQFAGGTQTFRAKGSSVGIITWDGPTGGTATATVTTPNRNTVTTTINTYQATSGDQTTTISDLPKGTHTVTLTVNGTDVSPSTGTWVGLDGVVVGGTTENTPKTTALWGNYPGDYTYTSSKGASFSLRFQGTGVVWSAFTGPNDGMAKVVIDGTTVATEDLYASGYGTTAYTFSGLSSDSLHTVVITALGTQDSSSSGDIVTNEGLTVQ
jgi:Bacterial Ig-like domain (group 3)